jgi:hypothetical protein
MSSESELIKALSQMVVTQDPPIEYRLHYNEDGNIYMCSMQTHPDSEQYIVVDKETYAVYFRYQVVNKKLKLIEHDTGVRVALLKKESGTPVVKNHASLVIEPNETYPHIEHYEYRNN